MANEMFFLESVLCFWALEVWVMSDWNIRNVGMRKRPKTLDQITMLLFKQISFLLRVKNQIFVQAATWMI